MYQPRRAARTAHLRLRHVDYHVRQWGEPGPGRVPLVLAHGWMDVSASWQFVVDELAQDHWIIAPDWRGFGLTAAAPVDTYWFPDYLADLDALLDELVGDTPINLVGHSMGGHIVTLYAGARPERIRCLVNLEGFGAPGCAADEAPLRYGRWLDELRAQRRGESPLRTYDDLDGVAARLMKTNRRLARDKADWLARQWARQAADGRWHILGDPAHKIVNAEIARVDEIEAAYRRITAPTLAVIASDDSLAGWWGGRYTLAEFKARLAHIGQLEQALVQDAGHMLHHDQPEQVARLIEAFL